jgi:putative mRNA 3-end processing factor
MNDLIVLRREGLYCPPGGFYIDPWRPVDRAVITHAHADHARHGHAHYLAQTDSAGILRSRIGASIPLQTLAYGESLVIQGVKLSLHPAGHVLGSSQVRLEHGGQVWVASGDYFASGVEGDINATCPPFEPVRCDCFITESTFGLPIYRWAAQREVMAEINTWWAANAAQGRVSLLMGYSFGKAQRMLAGVDASIGPIRVHAAVAPLNQAYRQAGVALPEAPVLGGSFKASELRGALVIAPPGVHGSAWARKLGADASDAFASGWMRLRGARRRQSVDRGFVLSDHADWPGLMRAIHGTGASRVIVTHGYEAVMVRHLQALGLQASSFVTAYGDEALDNALDAGLTMAPGDAAAQAPTGATTSESA